MGYLYTVAFHIAAVALWIGSTALIFFLAGTDRGDSPAGITALLHGYRRIALPAFAAAAVSGTILIMNDVAVMRSGWFYAKGALLIAMIGCFFWLGHKLEQLAGCDEVSFNATIGLGLLLAVSLGITVLAVARPF